MDYISLLETTQNTRDLGGYQTCFGGRTRFLSVLRSDIQKYPSAVDRRFLLRRGITTIIDLRGTSDAAKAPSGFAGQADFSYTNIPIDEGSGVPPTPEAVPASYMAIAAAANISSVFRCIANAQTGVMINCTAGKDRTGVVSALLLLHVGVADADIIENYVLTREYGRERLALIHRNFPEIDLRIVTPCDWYMEEFLSLFRKKYGDTERYFREIGLTDMEILRLREKLV